MHKRNQAADERRRRMLLDESCSSMPAISSSSTAEDREEAARKKRSYTSAARSGRQPRLIDLAPKRWPAFLAHITLGGLAIAGIDWLARNARNFGATFDPQLLALFEPAALGSLARWMATLWLLTAAALCVIIYTVRRHKADDYRGGYRAWLWASVLFILASFDAATSAHRLLGAVLVHQFGTPLGGNGAGWWLGTWGVLLGLVGLRLAVDMRASRAALAAASFAALAYTAVAVSLVWPPLVAQLHQSATTIGTVLLTGHLFWLTALALNARFVFLDAQGLIAEPAPRTSRAERKAQREENEEEASRAARRKTKKAKRDKDEAADDTSPDEAAESKPRRFLFWTLRSAEERDAARREKEDERELRREAKLEARREARENKAAAKADKLSTRDARRDDKQAARDLKREERQQQKSGKQSKKKEKPASKQKEKKETRQDRSEKPSPLAAKVHQTRQSESNSSSDDDDDMRHLSKAERKRLKKQRRREMREAA